MLEADDTDGTLTAQRTDSLASVFRSIGVLYQREGGRVPAYFVVLFELMVGKGFFNLMNAAAFALLMAALSLTASARRTWDVRVLVFGFLLYWYLLPLFGQMNLWVNGSVAYLRSATAVLCFLTPYLRRHAQGGGTAPSAGRHGASYGRPWDCLPVGATNPSCLARWW